MSDLVFVFMIAKAYLPKKGVQAFAIMEEDAGGAGGLHGRDWRGKGG
jgi:hypothetical protein